MSETLKEMLRAWEQSRKNPSNTPLPERFYDVRKRPTGKPKMKGHSFTPIGEALRCRELGLDKKIAKEIKK
jgi:hypothetical protein